MVISWQKRPWSVHRNPLKIRHWDCKLVAFPVATLNLTSNVIIIKFDIKVISGFLNYWNSVCVYKYTHSQVSHTKWIWSLHILYLKKISWWTPSCFLVHTLLFRKGRDESLKFLFKAEARKALFGSLLGAASRKAQVHLSLLSVFRLKRLSWEPCCLLLCCQGREKHTKKAVQPTSEQICQQVLPDPIDRV